MKSERKSNNSNNIQVKEKKEVQQNPFAKLDIDTTLYILSYVHDKKDVAALCQSSQASRKLLDKPKFWQQRELFDHHRYISDNVYAKNIYARNFEPSHIQKIVDMHYFTLGIDHGGHVQMLAESFDKDNAEARKRLLLIADFVKDKRVIDIYKSDGGACYIRTDAGLYGFGSNYHGELGAASPAANLDAIRLIQASTPDQILLQADCGVNFSLTRTKDEVMLRGKVTNGDNKNQVRFRAGNVVDVKCGSDRAFAVKRNNTLIEFDKAGPRQVAEFDNKTIKEVQTKGHQAVVWCKEGIYVSGVSHHGHLGYDLQPNGFARLDFFNDKKVFNVYLGDCHMVVRCREGVFVSGMNNTGRLGTGDHDDRLQFTKLDVDANKITNMHLTSNSFMEMDGQWRMAGTFASAFDVNLHKTKFEEVHFVPMQSLCEDRRHRPACS